jgi:hypothetical protein
VHKRFTRGRRPQLTVQLFTIKDITVHLARNCRLLGEELVRSRCLAIP